MRERELIHRRAVTLLRCYTDEDPRRLKGTTRAGYRMLLRGLRGLMEWSKKYGKEKERMARKLKLRKHERVMVVHLKSGGADVGKMFDRMMRFISGKNMLAVEVVAETHTFPGRTERLIIKLPKPAPVLSVVATRANDVRKGGRRR